MTRDPHEILGIPTDATLAEAKAAYRRLAELFHPDRLQGLRAEVQSEGARRLREATDAMRMIGAEFGRPLNARGHKTPGGEPGRSASGQQGGAAGRPAPGHRGGGAGPGSGHRGDAGPASAHHRSQERPGEPQRNSGDHAGVPIRPGHVDPGSIAWQPSDQATHAEARMYDVELRGVDGPTFHVRWTGRHAQATLAALRHGHRIDGAIRQVEWGSYEGVFDGAAVRRLICSVLHDEVWRSDLAEVVHLNGTPVSVLRGGGRDSFVELGAVLDLLEEGRRYSVLADVY